MVTTLFTDSDGRTITAHLNADCKCFIESVIDENNMYGFVCLDIDDLATFIEHLKKIKKEMVEAANNG